MLNSRQDRCRLQRLQRVLDNIRPLADNAYKVNGHGLGEQRQVRRGEVLLGEASFARNGAKPGMGVLEILQSVSLMNGTNPEVARTGPVSPSKLVILCRSNL